MKENRSFWRKKNQNCNRSRSYQMPNRDCPINCASISGLPSDIRITIARAHRLTQRARRAQARVVKLLNVKSWGRKPFCSSYGCKQTTNLPEYRKCQEHHSRSHPLVLLLLFNLTLQECRRFKRSYNKQALYSGLFVLGLQQHNS